MNSIFGNAPDLTVVLSIRYSLFGGSDAVGLCAPVIRSIHHDDVESTGGHVKYTRGHVNVAKVEYSDDLF